MLTKIFDAFVQADRSPTRSSGGLGIGLTLAKRLTELHGGTLRVESGGYGHGSRFTVILPLARSAAGRRADTLTAGLATAPGSSSSTTV
jgi:signal transduction histidine kinase